MTLTPIWLAQAKMTIGYYNQLRSPAPTPAIKHLDLLLIHWPINCGPCAVGGTTSPGR